MVMGCEAENWVREGCHGDGIFIDMEGVGDG